MKRKRGTSMLAAGKAAWYFAPVCLAVALSAGVAHGDDSLRLLMRGSFSAPVATYPDSAILANSRLRTGTGIVHGDVADDFSLALRSALETDFKLRQSIAESRVRRSEFWSEIASFLPTVTASIRHTRGTDITSSTRGSVIVEDESVLGVDVSVPLMTSGSRIFGLKRASAQIAAADYDVLASENDVVADAANAYLEMIASRKREEALEHSVSAVGSIVAITREKLNRGFADRHDLALAQAKLALVRREYDRAIEQSQKAETEFMKTVGTLPAGLLSEPAVNPVLDATVEEAVARALRHNPRLLSAGHAARAANFGVGETLGEHLARIDLTGSYERGIAGVNQGESWNVGVKLSVPLFDPNALPDVNKARHEASAARYRALDVRRDIEKLIRDEWATYHSSHRQLGHEKRRLQNLQTAATAATKRYRHGYSALEDVLERQLEVLDSEVALAELEAKKSASGYRLAVETGS